MTFDGAKPTSPTCTLQGTRAKDTQTHTHTHTHTQDHGTSPIKATRQQECINSVRFSVKGPPNPMSPTGQKYVDYNIDLGSLLPSEGQFLSFVHPNETSAFLGYRCPSGSDTILFICGIHLSQAFL